MKLGFVGLGAMGVPRAKNLIKAGHDLAVWNRTAGRDEALVEAGARQVERLADIGRGAQAVILMLADDGAVRKVLFGEGGGDRHEHYRCCRFGGECRGFRRTRSPHAGCAGLGECAGVEARTLVIMVGGEAAVLGEYRPVWRRWAKIFHLGPSGSGTRMKLIVNLVAATNLSVLAESSRSKKRTP